MLKIIGMSLLAGLGGYVVGMIAAMVLINYLSSNTHDRSVEAAMSSVFVYGPVSGILSFVFALIYLLPRANG